MNVGTISIRNNVTKEKSVTVHGGRESGNVRRKRRNSGTTRPNI